MSERMGRGFADAVKYFRENPDKWEKYKADFYEAHEGEEVEFVDEVLVGLDSLYGRFGGVAPFAVLAANALLEARRVRRLSKVG